MVIKNRSRICLLISAAIIIAAVLLTIFGHGINLGIDFDGGLSMQYDVKTTVNKAVIETALDKMDVGAYVVNVQGAKDNEINVRIKDVAKDDIQNIQAAFENEIRAEYPEAESIGDVSYVGPVAGATLVRNAVVSVLLSGQVWAMWDKKWVASKGKKKA